MAGATVCSPASSRSIGSAGAAGAGRAALAPDCSAGTGCPVPLNASQSACLTRSRFAAPACGHWNGFENGAESWTGGYGCMLNSSKIGFVRPDARYASPRYLMNHTGEWLGFEVALALSLPRDEIAGPQTIESGRTVFSASYACASVCS